MGGTGGRLSWLPLFVLLCPPCVRWGFGGVDQPGPQLAAPSPLGNQRRLPCGAVGQRVHGDMWRGGDARVLNRQPLQGCCSGRRRRVFGILSKARPAFLLSRAGGGGGGSPSRALSAVSPLPFPWYCRLDCGSTRPPLKACGAGGASPGQGACPTAAAAASHHPNNLQALMQPARARGRT
jgi:hypothetical protein